MDEHANKLVSNPIFSALAKASSVVPTLRHFSLKFKILNFLKIYYRLDGLLIQLKNDAPKIVSGRS